MAAPVCSRIWCRYFAQYGFTATYVGDVLDQGVLWHVWKCPTCEREYRTLAN